MDEYRYVVTIHDWEENEHYPLGVYSTDAKAHEAMDGEMSAVHGQSEYTDWENDCMKMNKCSSYFYDGFTVEIERFRVDD